MQKQTDDRAAYCYTGYIHVISHMYVHVCLPLVVYDGLVWVMLMMYDRRASSSSLPTYSWQNSDGLACESWLDHPFHCVPFPFHVHVQDFPSKTAEGAAAAVHVTVVAVGDDAALQLTAVGAVADAVLQPR